MLGRVLLAALAGYVALAAMDLLDRLNYDKQLKFNDDKCTLLYVEHEVYIYLVPRCSAFVTFISIVILLLLLCLSVAPECATDA